MTTTQKHEEGGINIGRLVGGLVLLASGILLAVLTFVLPENKMMFMIGDDNLPIVPAVIMVLIGGYLVATSRKSELDIVIPEERSASDLAKLEERKALNKRLEGIGWGLFLIMLGGFALVPHETIPKGLWSIGVGVIMLGLNATRYYYGLRMSGFTTFLGILSLFGGIAQLVGFYALEGALLFLILGAYLVLKPWFDKKQMFGKIEEG